MKHSIRVKMTLIFMGIMAAALAAMLVINNFFLEPFYTGEKVDLLQEAYEELNRYVVSRAEEGKNIIEDFGSLYSQEGEQNDVSRMIRQMNEKYTTTIVLIDSQTDRMVPAFPNNEFLADRRRWYILGIWDQGTETLVSEDNFMIQKTYDWHSKSYYLQNWGFFDDNRTIFIMSMPIASIQESVQLSNRFMLYVGLTVLAGGSILIYFATKRITSPIMSLASLSARMSELDFDARYTGEEENEIGVLGRSMNTLSEKLKDTIGELKTANNELQKDIEEKIRVDETRKEFIANVSHELKTPIALIQGYAEGLTEGMAEDTASRDYYCEVIMDEAGKMNRMVKQLLTLTALEFGNDKPVMEQFDIVGLIQGLLSSANILIQQKEAHVVFEAAAPVYVWADEFKIEEVVTNYLNNALNHLAGERLIRVRVDKGRGR